METAEQGTPRRGVETDPVRALAAELAEVKKAITQVGKAASLRNSTISDSNGVVRLRFSTDEGAVVAYDETGEEVARYGLLAHSDPGQYGIEVNSGGWVHIGAQVASWSNLAGKPATFPATAHTHPGADVTSAVASATSAALAQQAEGSQYAYDNNVAGTQFYAVYVGNSGGFKFGRNTSSARYKENIRDFVGDMSDLMAVRPVLFDRLPTMGEAPVWTDPDGVEWPAEGPVQQFEGRKDEYGFIAEEILEVWPEVVQYFDHGDGLGPVVDGIRYELIAARLIPILQGMLITGRTVKKRVDDLELRVTAVEKNATDAIVALRARVKTLEDWRVTATTKAASQDTLIANLDTRLKTLGA